MIKTHASLLMAAMLALPAIWVNSLAMLVAVIPLWRMASKQRPEQHSAAA